MDWQAEQVIAELTPLCWSSTHHVDGQLQAYSRYYGLNFEDKISGLSHEIGYFDAHGFRLACHVYQHPSAKGTAFLQHGLYDHMGLYGHLIAHCLELGFNVFCYDLPGHGLSTGDRASINTFQQYDQVFDVGVQISQQNLAGPMIAVGQSTGCAVISNYLLSRGINRENSPFAYIFMMAPLVRPCFWRLSVMSYYLFRPFISRLKRTFTENSSNVGFIDFISTKDPLQPLYLQVQWVGALKQWIEYIEQCPSVDIDITIIQGNEDETVDYRHNIKILKEKFLGSSVHFIQGARHHLVNESKEMRRQIFELISP